MNYILIKTIVDQDVNRISESQSDRLADSPPGRQADSQAERQTERQNWRVAKEPALVGITSCVHVT